MKVEEIDALLGGEAQRLSDQYREVPLDFMDGYGWAVTQICRLFRDAVPVIRCKDCKYWLPHAQFGFDEDNNEYHNYCERLVPDDDFYAFTREADEFCSRAERKEE